MSDQSQINKEECIPSPGTVEHAIEEKELTGIINVWLSSLPKNDRVLFMRRYWNGEAVNALAAECGITQGRLAKRMYILRQNLKATLEREGYL